MSTQRNSLLNKGGDESDDEEPGTEVGPSSSKRKRTSSPVPKNSKPQKRKKSRKGGDVEYGVSRGVDFIDVACVLNFDLPSSSRS